MVKYIGSKRALLPWIMGVVSSIRAADDVRSAADLFSGTARVGRALKRDGLYVHSNDVTAYSHTLALALVQADANDYSTESLQPMLDELNDLPGVDGYFTEHFCREGRYFREENGRRIDAIRPQIEEQAASDPVLKAILLTSLMLAADRVDSTTGVQMAYLKRYAPRAYQPLELRLPPLEPGSGVATREDAIALADSVEADLVYLDPPYNQHSYLSNYHIWESLVLNDRPNVYGTARKREDCKTRKSPFNFKAGAAPAMEALLSRLQKPKHLILSFSDEGFFTVEHIETMLSAWGYVKRIERPHRRYVGAQIGIYNPKGKKVGQVSHLQNREFLFVASKSRQVIDAVSM